MDRFQIFLDSRLKLDAILNTSICGDKDVPYAKNLPDCDFSSEGTLKCEPDRCKFPVTVLKLKQLNVYKVRIMNSSFCYHIVQKILWPYVKRFCLVLHLCLFSRFQLWKVYLTVGN